METQKNKPIRNDITNLIISYECGELDEDKCLELFAELIKSGLCWKLQGHYGRQASALIEAGILDAKGNFIQQD